MLNWMRKLLNECAGSLMLWNLNFWVQWRKGSESIEFMWTSQCWAAVWISLQEIDGMPWAVTAKSHPWRKPAWRKCVMKSPTNINSVQALQTIRTNSSCRHCLVFQRRHWGDLLSWTHGLKPPQWFLPVRLFVWRKQCTSIMEDVIDIYLGLLWYFSS